MISKKMVGTINKQINAELYSSYLYLSMSAYSTLIGLAGAANWFYVQSKEEMTHALKMFNYINDQGEHVELKAIDGPATSFKSLEHMFAETLKHEKVVTSLINNIVSQAKKENDHATEIFYQWFVTEQIEEEKNASEILAKVKLAGNNSGGLFMIDNELKARIFTPPVGLIL
jgi:ferritin